ncbi:MAG: VCBS repeat-containing protein [Bacteroidetes bacterium]|nr:VCBS repeat-containing protein [Bacteroidota bacterium]
MKSNHRHILLTLLIFFSIQTVYCQSAQSILFNQLTPAPGILSGSYYARDNIEAVNVGTEAITSGKSILLAINKNVQVPVQYLNNISNVNPNDPYDPSASIDIIDKPIDEKRAVGSLVGNADVSITGSASYNIPIEIAPGTNGMEPQIGLSYNSNLTNGILGRGWSISGISAISLVNKSYYYDGKKEGILFDGDDPIALDGNRLIPSPANGVNTYRPERENFTLTTKVGNYYKVQTKAGLTMFYGLSQDSKLQLGSNILVWYLTSVYDTYGNYIKYSYNNDQGEVTIKEIAYTGTQQESPYNYIHFYYDKRKDANPIYFKGHSIQNSLILREVEVICESKSIKRYNFKYIFSVQSFLREVTVFGADNTVLNSTFFKYGDLIKQQTITFTDPIVQISNNSLPGNADFILGDYNGDGKTDLLACLYNSINAYLEKSYSGYELYFNQNNGTSFSKAPFTGLIDQGTQPFMQSDHYSQFLSGPIPNTNFDINQDGKDDVILVTENMNQKEYTVYFATGFGFTPGKTVSIGNTEQIYFADINGDGRLEGITYYNDTYFLEDEFHVFLLDEPIQGVAVPLIYPYSFNPSSVPYDSFRFADYDGDGINVFLGLRYGGEDIIKFSDPLVSPANYFASYIGGFAGTSGSGTQNYPCDFNGDGTPDELRLSNWSIASMPTYPSVPAASSILYGTGNGLGASIPLLDHPLYPFFNKLRRYLVSDINNDGKSDILVVTTNDPLQEGIGIYVYYGGQTIPILLGGKEEYEPPRLIDLSMPGNYLPLPINSDNLPEFLIGDFDGDGRGDIFMKHINIFHAGLVYWSIVHFNEGKNVNLLSSVTNGFRYKTDFEYKSLANADASVYTKTQSVILQNTFPILNVQIPYYVVSKTTAPNAKLNGFVNTTFKYENAKLHLTGKGFLGFDKVTSYNDLNGLKVEKIFGLNTTYYEREAISIKSFINAASTPFSEQTNAFTYIDYPEPLRHFSYVEDKINIDHLTGNEEAVHQDINADGNITSNSQTITGTETEFTITDYTISPFLYNTWLPSRYTSSLTTTKLGNDTPYDREILFEYNSDGSLHKKTLDPHKSLLVITEYGYDNNTGVLLNKTTTPPASTPTLPIKTVHFEYDSKHRFVIRNFNELGQVIETAYNPNWGKPISVKGIDNLLTEFYYDGFGQEIKSRFPNNSISQTSISWIKQSDHLGGEPLIISNNALYSITKKQDGKPEAKSFYDLFGHELKSEIESFSNITGVERKIYSVNEFDEKGNLINASGPYEGTMPLNNQIVINNFTYEPDYNRILQESNNINIANPIDYTYNFTGGYSTITKSYNGQMKSEKYNAIGLLSSSNDNGGSISYIYGSGRKLTSTTVGGDPAIVSHYNEYGMQDYLNEKNSGLTSYNYNAYDLISQQTDANLKTYTIQYDELNRIKYKYLPDGGLYEYKYVPNGPGINQLEMITDINNNPLIHYYYDDFNRITMEDKIIKDQVFTTKYQYDQIGNLIKYTYPSGFSVEYKYQSNTGYLTEIIADNGQSIWKAVKMNHFGQYSTFKLGNNPNTIVTYNSLGLVESIAAGNIQNLKLNFDIVNGNPINKKEIFTYDQLDRLIGSQIVDQSSANLLYDPIDLHFFDNGNIDGKSNVGTYSYNGTGPHAISEIAGISNLPSPLIQTIEYTDFNKTKKILDINNNKILEYEYDAFESRIYGKLSVGNNIEERYYISDYEKNIDQTDITEVHYIGAPSGLAAIYVIQNGVKNFYYVYTDHLGSIQKLTNEQGVVIAKQDFDAWGNYRNPDDWTFLTQEPINPKWLYRGYTGHEHIKEFSLINMNARLYDPVINSMLSPDNYVQTPNFTQNYNRYSYGLNNPLKYTDPTGNFNIGYLGLLLGESGF